MIPHIISEETRKRMSESHLGKSTWTKGAKFTEEHKANLSKAHKGQLSLKRGLTFEQMYGAERAKKIKLKSSLSHKGQISWMKGKKHSEKSKDIMSKSRKGIINSPKMKLKLSQNAKINPNYGMKGKHHSEKTKLIYKSHWADPIKKEQRIKATSKGLMKRPTSFEQKISDLCFKYNLPFIYTGNRSFLINFKNPDFVNERDKIVIEVYHSWFKIKDYGSVENYQEYCIEKYQKFGWKVIFIDETEVENEDWEEICLNKIKQGGISNEQDKLLL